MDMLYVSSHRGAFGQGYSEEIYQLLRDDWSTVKVGSLHYLRFNACLDQAAHVSYSFCLGGWDLKRLLTTLLRSS